MNPEPLTPDGKPRAPIVEVKILDRRVHGWGLPRYQTDMAAAVDLFASVDAPIALEAQAAAQLIPSGIAVHIGDPHIVGLIVPRSGLGHGKGLVLGNVVGVLDPDFEGPLMISAWNRSCSGTEPIIINPGDRIAQLIFLPILRPQFRTVTDFSKTTDRGAGGFGSTGQALIRETSDTNP